MELAKFPVFVYGTLKKGFWNHHYLDGQVYIGPAVMPGVLYDLGPFPGYGVGGNTPIIGELYHTTKERLAMMDVLEGVPELYSRILRHAIVDGKKIPAWVYEYVPQLGEKLKAIPSGEWVNKREQAKENIDNATNINSAASANFTI